jgi:hypothetical protein
VKPSPEFLFEDCSLAYLCGATPVATIALFLSLVPSLGAHLSSGLDIESEVLFSQLDGGEHDLDGSSDGTLTVDGLFVGRHGRILVDVPRVVIQVEDEARVLGVIEGPMVESFVLRASSRLRLRGASVSLDGADLRFCGPWVEVAESSVSAGGIAVSADDRVRGSGSSLSAERDIVLVACGEDHHAIRAKGLLVTVETGGEVHFEARRGGVFFGKDNEVRAPGGAFTIRVADGLFGDLPVGEPPAEVEVIAPSGERCDCGGPDDGGAELVVLSPPDGALVQRSGIGVEIAGDSWTEVDVELPAFEVSVAGVSGLGRTYALGLPLVAGENELIVRAVGSDGSVQTATLRVEVVPTGRTLLRVDAIPRFGDALPHEARLEVHSEGLSPVTEVLLDHDADGGLDAVFAPGESPQLAVQSAGIHPYGLAVRSDSGVLYAVAPGDRLPLVVVEPPAPEAGAIDAGGPILDMELEAGSGGLFVLNGNREVRVFDAGGILVRTITLAGTQQPAGLGLDMDGNLYVADGGLDKVLRLVAVLGYAPDPELSGDGFFGSSGSGPGELHSPVDVAVAQIGDALRVFVADAGNGRVQRFALDGAFEAEIGARVLRNPRSIVASGAGSIAVLDVETGEVRLFGGDGAELLAFSALTSGGALDGHLARLRDGRFAVSDPGAGLLRIHGLRGVLEREIRLEGPGSIVEPEDVLGRRVLFASGNARTPYAFPLSPDPPGYRPLDRVRAFLEAMALRDLATARELVVPDERPVFDSFFANASLLANYAAVAVTTSDIEIVREDGSFCTVHASVTSPLGPVAGVELGLLRDPADGLWHLLSY